VREWERKYFVDVNAWRSNEEAMKPEDHARNSEISYSYKAPLPGELLVAMNNFLKAYDRYLALDKARVVWSTPQQKELMYIKLLRAYLSLLRRLSVAFNRTSTCTQCPPKLHSRNASTVNTKYSNSSSEM
jgi:hypothetical protein